MSNAKTYNNMFRPWHFHTVLHSYTKLTNTNEWTDITSKLRTQFCLLLSNKLVKFQASKHQTLFELFQLLKCILVHEKQKFWTEVSRNLTGYDHIGSSTLQQLLRSVIVELTCSVNTNMCTASTVNRQRGLCVCVVFQCSAARCMEPIMWQAGTLM
jgi:hypothetical protein